MLATILFDIIVQPLVLLIEFVFADVNRLVESPGVAIIFVSIAVNLLCLPLYRMADDQQEREREKQKSMERWVTHIKTYFKGDERYMMLSAYYAEQGYHPARALLGSLSLLLQIPFFMAAYSYLSNLKVLNGASFLFLANLGKPDAMLVLGGLTINVMPVVMTIFNCASTAIYTRGLPLRDKLQAYGLAAVFLVLLYDSPSGLVFYWTCNQLFSLGKNVFMKILPNPTRWAQVLAEICVCGSFIWLICAGKMVTVEQTVGDIVVFVIAQMLMILWIRKSRSATQHQRQTKAAGAKRPSTVVTFFLAAMLLTILIGLLIPSAILADSPTEFVDPANPANPLRYLVHSTCVWGGAFVLWAGTYFLLSGERARKIFALVMWCLCGICMLQYFAFGTGLGNISPELVYDKGVSYEIGAQIINGIALAGFGVALVLVWRHFANIVTPALVVGLLAIAALSVPNITQVASSYATYFDKPASSNDPLMADGVPRQILHLSQTKQNVVVMFLDRAISGYVPFFMAERPELASKLDGFTYYPNTLSFGGCTNLGGPALYGGYDYTPTAMNARTTELIPDKHNEALVLMPTLFSGQGYRTTVVDPPYAGNYQWDSDLSIYDDLPNTEAYAVKGAYTNYDMKRYGITPSVKMGRQFAMYGLMRALPDCMQWTVYDNGTYWSTNSDSTIPVIARNEIATLDVLPEITSAESDKAGFVLMCDILPHEPCRLQLPDYDPAPIVDNDGLEDFSRFELNGRKVNVYVKQGIMHYHTNMATFIRLGRWFDWMRENNVYDNTRIILVADHGRDLHQFEEWLFDDKLDVQMVNPLLMVKDFNAHGFTTSDEFMTNADVPTIALQGIVQNPVNPATGNEVSSAEKTAHDQYVTASSNWETSWNRGYTFDTSDAPWYSVHDNIFDMSNWKRLKGEPEVSK